MCNRSARSCGSLCSFVIGHYFVVVGTIERFKTSQTFNLVILWRRSCFNKSLVQFNQITFRAMRSRCVGYPTFNWNSCIYKTLRYTIFEITFEKENNHCQRCIPTKLQLPPATWRPKEKRYNDTEQNHFFPFHRVKMMGESLHWSDLPLKLLMSGLYSQWKKSSTISVAEEHFRACLRNLLSFVSVSLSLAAYFFFFNILSAR